jgi:8-oxo-dGTP pyrophosphatase MutT (NUDIX family)
VSHHPGLLRIDWIPASAAAAPARWTRAKACCVDDAGFVVLVRQHDQDNWVYPGGRPKQAETPEQTMIREVAEEACATVLDHEFVGCWRIAELDADVETKVDFE